MNFCVADPPSGKNLHKKEAQAANSAFSNDVGTGCMPVCRSSELTARNKGIDTRTEVT